jgi:hypothetical protein
LTNADPSLANSPKQPYSQPPHVEQDYSVS